MGSLFDDLPQATVSEQKARERRIMVKSHERVIGDAKPKRERKPKESLQTAAIKFHEQNPAVFQRLVNMALALKRQGVEKYGLAAL